MYNKNDRDELSSETVMIVQNYAYHTVQMSVNDLRNYKNQYNKKKMLGPEVQQLPGGGAWCHILFVPVHGILLGFSYLTLCPLILLAFCS